MQQNTKAPWLVETLIINCLMFGMYITLDVMWSLRTMEFPLWEIDTTFPFGRRTKFLFVFGIGLCNFSVSSLVVLWFEAPVYNDPVPIQNIGHQGNQIICCSQPTRWSWSFSFPLDNSWSIWWYCSLVKKTGVDWGGGLKLRARCCG